MSEIRVFCSLPEYTGYTSNGFEVDVNVKMYQDEPATNHEFQKHLIASVGQPLSAKLTELYTAIITEASDHDLVIPAQSDIFMPVPMSLEKLAQGQSSVSRSLDSAYQISTTANILVNYSVDIVSSLSISGGEQGTIYLEVADDSGFTANVQEVSRATNGNTGTLTIGLSTVQTSTARLAGAIKVGKYVRLRTQQNTGSPTFTYRSGQEVIV